MGPDARLGATGGPSAAGGGGMPRPGSLLGGDSLARMGMPAGAGAVMAAGWDHESRR